MKKNSPLNVILCLVFVLGFCGCRNGDEGCLDPNALNLDVTADVNANCQYPFLRLNVSHRWTREQAGDTLNFRLGDLYAYGADSVSFSLLKFYVTASNLGRARSLVVFDSVETVDDNWMRDDLTVITPASFQFEAGHVNDFGDFDEFSMNTGFGTEWYSVDTIKLKEEERNHPWFDENMRAGGNQRYTARLGYTLYGQNDTLKRSVGLTAMSVTGVTKPGYFRVPQANHADVGLFIDYRKLLDGVDLRTDDASEIQEKMSLNFDSSIFVIK